MKLKTLATTATAIATLAIVSCENPADKTTDAEVGEAKEAASGEGQKYIFTDQSKIEFTGSKVTGSHSGGFKKFNGHFTLADGAEVPSSGSFTIDMHSTWSDNERLTTHLKKADFFNVVKFSESTFELTSVEKKSELEYTVAGNFTLHGTTKNISFPAQVATGDDTITMKSEFDINRKDFGIVYTGKKDDLIRDEVIIRLDLTANVE